jgi:phosphoglycerate dehydrogenase-like enzyme
MDRVLLVYPLHPSAEERLLQHVEVVRPVGDDGDSLAAAVGDVDAVILHGPAHLTAALIERAAKLRIIAAVGAGADNIDIAAATRRGIPVTNGAGVAFRPVAEYVIAAMVAGHRRLFELHRALVDGDPIDWPGRGRQFLGTQLTGTTLGLIGYGHIGRDVSRIASAAYDVDVLVYDPYLPQTVDLGGAQRLDSLEELLDRSLTVSLHVPLTEETRGILGRDELRRIGPNGVLINASRGGTVDEGALVAALHSGELKAAVIDVFADEPPRRDQIARLGACPNAILTPHIAGITDQTRATLADAAVDSVLAALEGRRPARLANPDVVFPPD